MKQAVHDVIPRHPMPKSHHQEVDQVSDLADANAIFDQLVFHDEESRSHENKISEPKAQTHVPAIPELFDIRRSKRFVEVHWRLDAHDQGNRYRKQTVPGKIKEQVHRVVIHITNQ